MKRYFLLMLISSTAAAMDNKNHPYLGINAFAGYNTKLDITPTAVNETAILAGGAFVGYNFALNPNLDLGIELEYQHFGETEFTHATNAAQSGTVDGNAVFVNIRPKLIEFDNNLYSAFILGAGKMQTNVTQSNQSLVDDKFAYQFGIEVGYMLNNVDLSIGYRYRGSKFRDVNMSVQGATLGARYNF